MKKQIIKDMEKAIIFGLIFSVILSISRFDASCEDLRQNILRIHIIANSNSDLDQSVKFKVRDAILQNSKDTFSNCNTLEIAKENAKENLTKFTEISNKVLKENGFSYFAKSSLGKSFFETREYETFTLPAGYYDSLIIKLGDAKGKNYWCVIYPSVCIESSKAKLTKSVKKKSAYVAENPQKYKMKFKAVEIYENYKHKKTRTLK